MKVEIIRENGRLRLENLSCDCGFSHVIPQMDIYIKSGLIEDCADCVVQSGLGKRLLIVADSITHRVAAKAIESTLQKAGFDCRLRVLPDESIEPTPQMAAYIRAAIDERTEFLLAVGSGVITDLTRRAAFLAGLPFAVFGTAASMDGYTSITSAMVEDGMKISRYGNAARLLMFDTAVLAAAPKLMHASGVGDVFAKYNVLADWQLGRDVAGERYCPLCVHLVEQALQICADHMDEIAAHTEKGAQALIEALILAGLSVLIVGSTRPVASVEHNIAHYFEMMHLAHGGAVPSHGISAGIGTIYALMMHGMLYKADVNRLNKAAIKRSRQTRAQKSKLIRDNYPKGIGAQIQAENKQWYLSWREQERRIDALAKSHAAYQKRSAALLPGYMDVVRVLHKLGAPVCATQAGISEAWLKNALLYAKDYRQRYNIATALYELGMLKVCVEDIMMKEEQLRGYMG